MVKINENEVLISRHEILFVLVGAAGAHGVRANRLENAAAHL